MPTLDYTFSMNTEHQDTIAVHVYGKLCRHLSEDAPRHKRVIHVDARPDETLSTLLKRLDIEPAELYRLSQWQYRRHS